MPQTIDLSWCQDLEEAALKKKQLQMEKEVREAEGKLNLGKKHDERFEEQPNTARMQQQQLRQLERMNMVLLQRQSQALMFLLQKLADK